MGKETINIVNPQTGKVQEIQNGTFTMQNSEDGKVLTIHIDGFIGWWHDKSELRYYLQSTQAEEVIFMITSEGGDPRHSTAMKNYVEDMKKQKGFSVKTIMSGYAASSATHFALCGDVREMYDNVLALYHEPTFMLRGKVNELKDQIESFKAVQDAIMADYMKYCTKTEDEMMQMFKKDAWISAETVKDFGFITDIVSPGSVEMSTSQQSVAQFTMLGLPPIQNHKNFNTQMEKVQKELIDKHGFTMADLAGKSEEELNALLAEKDTSAKKSIVEMVKEVFTSTSKADSEKELKAKLAEAEASKKESEEALLMLAQKHKDLEEKVSKIIPQAPVVPGAQNKLNMFGSSVNVGQSPLMFGGPKGKEGVGIFDGKAFGMVSVTKPKIEDQSNLHPIEMLALSNHPNKISAGREMFMAGTAFDVAQLNAELGAASIQVLNEIVYEKQRVDSIVENFTLIEGIKDKRYEIEGFISPVSQPFHVKPKIGDDQYNWEVHKIEVQDAVAAVQFSAYDLAKTYFGRLQRPGYDPYNYPAVLMIWEMLADRILADVSKIAVNGERDASVAGTTAATLANAYLKSFDGFNKVWDDILSAGTGGVTAVATGTIFGTDAHVLSVGESMRLAVDEEFRSDDMVIYCSEAWAIRYYKALLATYPNMVAWKETQGVIPEGLKIENSNITLKPLKGFSGSERLVVTPQWNAVVAMDFAEDLNRMYVRDVALCQEVYVPYQAKSNMRRISTRFLAINNQ